MDARLIVESDEARRLEAKLSKLRRITAEIRRHMPEPKITSDHGWLYDEDGLPR